MGQGDPQQPNPGAQGQQPVRISSAQGNQGDLNPQTGQPPSPPTVSGSQNTPVAPVGSAAAPQAPANVRQASAQSSKGKSPPTASTAHPAVSPGVARSALPIKAAQTNTAPTNAVRIGVPPTYNPQSTPTRQITGQSAAQKPVRVAPHVRAQEVEVTLRETAVDVLKDVGRRGKAGGRALLHFALASLLSLALFVLFFITLLVLPVFTKRHLELEQSTAFGISIFLMLEILLSLLLVMAFVALIWLLTESLQDGFSALRQAASARPRTRSVQATHTKKQHSSFGLKPKSVNKPRAETGIQKRDGKRPYAKPSQNIGSESNEMPVPIADQDQAFKPEIAKEEPKATAQLQPMAPTPPTLPPPAPSPKLDPAKFEVHEPDDKNDPVPHLVQNGISDGKDWAIVGSSRRGFGHEHEAKYREDGLDFRIYNGWHLAVVADGGGAYSLARVGANVAVNAALDGMEAKLRQIESMPSAYDEKALLTVIREILIVGLRSAFNAVRDEAAMRKESPKQLRTTLLLLIHHELSHSQIVGGAQIGDGVIVTRDANGALHWLGTPDTGPTGNEVLFLQDVDPDEWEHRVTALILPGAKCYCMAMTDGVADDFLPIDVNLERLERPLFESVLAGRQPKEAAHALTELLGYQRSASFDDRTLVCIYKRTMDTLR